MIGIEYIRISLGTKEQSTTTYLTTEGIDAHLKPGESLLIKATNIDGKLTFDLKTDKQTKKKNVSKEDKDQTSEGGAHTN